MTQTMLERAARAVYVKNTWDVTGVENRTPSFDDAKDVDRNHARSVARAVLMAVREPDEGLTYKAGWFSRDYSVEFTAMIDAILNEPQP